ncbi:MULTISPECIES: tRNA pseudouridine(55) synthase TruB [Mammaliicoccus]|uniref:tRNA pseudouridine synthase B n=2 Tax=Mammaliicoccus vitulinus TaxID=71237 RepID=A0A2T4PSW9_9STAP|nr:MULTISPECIES: tRNA pseudouridine(55) synthase TruB [Mammaliicoccus]HAL08808.1 tRNA pseudouridine(55) synthase TruB [Staphylococcus sp.]MBO3076901.1 tRNA pseudouridine(55) synthase TruB [Mammaliicoccus vitulinus]PTI29434.1 tRNA pseudouridine(55) synthase TruB [Mammaliicoccus vitulinus]PTI36815.1 tRNA pseudouridine(55) synthase TruB [Mammaliicoccus vitulinus]PTI72404.1 tRNA pseudouridine(55) synthase TruB [Mammaliicoccus vitulinus]
MDGILAIHKEVGMTSHDVVFKLRKILKTKKVGHTGTLDPEVSGVLPICIGKATRVSDYVMESGKTYKAEVTIGVSTTTEDQTGDIVEEKNVNENIWSTDDICSTINKLEGEIEQIPPMYSAVKVNGKKLYEYARQNIEVERPVRKVFINSIELISEISYDNQTCKFEIEVECGKGTYIRTLATQIGELLGFPAHMSHLIRLKSGGFSLEQAIKLDELRQIVEQDKLQDVLLPLEYGLNGLEKTTINDEEIVKRIQNGQKIEKQLIADHQFEGIFVVWYGDKAIAIMDTYEKNNALYKPKKVFL